MKKSRSFITLIVFAVILAVVGSCEEHDEKMETKYESQSNVIPGKDKSKASGGHIDPQNFNGEEGDPLDLETAKRWAGNFRNNVNNPDEILSHYFGFEIIQSILTKPGCVGIRIYYALDDTGEKKLLLVGVDSEGQDMLPVAGAKVGEGGNVVADYSLPCPTYCPGNGL